MRIIPRISALVFAAAISFGAAGATAQTTAVDTSTMTSNELYQYAEALRVGRGVPADADAALALHRQLAEAGRTQSFERMSIILISQNRLDEAKSALEQGTAAGNNLAAMRLAIGHLRGQFGPASDPELGFTQLEVFVEGSDNQFARYTLARAYEEGTGTDANLEEARAIYAALADEGHGASLRKLGDFSRDGTFGDTDLQEAAGYYRASAENGFDFSWLILARLNVDLADYADAISAYENAIDAGVTSAAAEYARAHFLGEFGPLSDRALGERALETAAESGDVQAAAVALQLWERRSRRIETLDLEGVIEMLDTQMRAGDTVATAALARAYRELSWRLPNARQRHAALVTDYGDQLGRRFFREFLHSSYDTAQHSQSRDRAYAYIQTLEGDEFAQAARALRSTEMTAFVYLLQKEFSTLGYYQGRASGVFNSSTLRAALRFCADQNIMDTCTHGPLTFSATSDIIDALADVRS